ncbi:uncharacterized protein LOC100439401 isoform X4 [Pongo abelii]|uniref:uncharacterized protein LOC100439401 isoform X4 n=1 Tax=Pongo abelii TaxID=9601 RepID=UPI0023E86472|nr:uncharacterized protein LOC100439401 isoform X2 [Pongo abelii]
MLYVLIESERARIKKLQEEKTRNLESSRKLEPRIVSEHRGGLRTEQTDIDVLGQHLTKEHVSSHSQSLIRDSQWFTLSPQEKLAWGTSSKDPRIAAGQQSPLEKKILRWESHSNSWAELLGLSDSPALASQNAGITAFDLLEKLLPEKQVPILTSKEYSWILHRKELKPHLATGPASTPGGAHRP